MQHDAPGAVPRAAGSDQADATAECHAGLAGIDDALLARETFQGARQCGMAGLEDFPLTAWPGGVRVGVIRRTPSSKTTCPLIRGAPLPGQHVLVT
jgi:hypothetical protein